VGLDDFTIDHIVPVSKRGPHLFHNLQLAHGACNSRKGDG
jgi:5-methylcytosine-specific restriction endonuclease McrA